MIQANSKSETAIRIRGLSKSYTIQKGGLEKQSTLTESALSRLKNPLRRAKTETFHALKDIDLDIKKGEVVGIIGRNGAGKSTLLKVLSRITYPTTGQVEIYGRVGSLLEVGTGFHPELTGRENIYLNGAILGMSRPEIKKEFDAIVDFAGVEKFLDTPVKRYSSGMYVRLAFAVAAHLRTEILIVDEVLAVGDQEFQKKCIGKMQDVADSEGRTVLLVSHLMGNIASLSNAVIHMKKGRVEMFGESGLAIDQYLGDWEHRPTYKSSATSTCGPSITSAGIINASNNSASALKFGEPFSIKSIWENLDQVSGPIIVYKFRDNQGNLLCVINSMQGWQNDTSPTSGTILTTFPSNPLPPGHYQIESSLWQRPGKKIVLVEDFLTFEVSGANYDDEFKFLVTGNPAFSMPAKWQCSEG